MNRFIKPVLATLVVATASAGAYAATAAPKNDALGISHVKTSLTQAITIAEQHATGKATEAKFDGDSKQGPLYEVEVVNGTKVVDVKVDANNGTVISSHEDKADSNDDDD